MGAPSAGTADCPARFQHEADRGRTGRAGAAGRRERSRPSRPAGRRLQRQALEQLERVRVRESDDERDCQLEEVVAMEVNLGQPIAERDGIEVTLARGFRYVFR